MNGARIGITAARRAREQAALVEALGGVPVSGPSVGVDHAAAAAALAPALDDLLANPPDIAVFITGVGGGHLVEAADAAGRGEALRAVLGRAEVVARGPKARRVLAGVGVQADWTAEPAETRELQRRLLERDLRGRRIAVQCVGDAPEPMVDALRAAGATVIELRPYVLGVSADDGALRDLVRAVADGTVDAVTFTSAMAVRAFADRMDDTELTPHPRVVVAAVGPVTREALRAHGWRVDVEPATARMGAMYQALAAFLAERGPAGGRP